MDAETDKSGRPDTEIAQSIGKDDHSNGTGNGRPITSDTKVRDTGRTRPGDRERTDMETAKRYWNALCTHLCTSYISKGEKNPTGMPIGICAMSSHTTNELNAAPTL